MHLPFLLVEVAGLELAASSTRNWRATTCATPRNFDIIAQFPIFVKGNYKKSLTRQCSSCPVCGQEPWRIKLIRLTFVP